MTRLFRAAVVLAAGLLAAGLVAAMAALPDPAVNLPRAVSARLGESGVEHPVTAVLLNFRGYDTLLEVAVLLIALLGMLAAGGVGEGRTALPPGEPVAQALARLAVPLMVPVAVYLLWAGAYRPGGAFQAGAVLGAAAVFLNLAGLLPGWPSPGLRLRLGLLAGFAIFLAVAAALLGQGALLQYPPPRAGNLILLVEGGLTVSLGLVLGGLFLFLSDSGDGQE